MKERFNLPLDHAAFVVNESAPGDFAVIPESPADKAGVKEFDIITCCNKEKVSEEQTLEDLISKSEVGDKIVLSIFRGNNSFDKEIILKKFQRV